jgi:hypothetical protein
MDSRIYTDLIALTSIKAIFAVLITEPVLVSVTMFIPWSIQSRPFRVGDFNETDTVVEGPKTMPTAFFDLKTGKGNFIFKTY